MGLFQDNGRQTSSADLRLLYWGNPFLMAASCLRATSVATPVSIGSLGAPSNSRCTSALPSVNNTTVTAIDLSSEEPERIAPLEPTSTGCHVPLTFSA